MFHTHQDFMVALAEGFKGARPIAVSVMSSSSGGIRKCWRVSVEKDGRITVDRNQWMTRGSVIAASRTWNLGRCSAPGPAVS